MRITVLFFASLAQRVGHRRLELDLPHAASIDQALSALCGRFPALQERQDQLAHAVNLEYVPRDTRLHEGDELALIPPVSGG